jgi:hypothetical protein
MLPDQAGKQIMKLLAGSAVQITRGFIGQEERR